MNTTITNLNQKTINTIEELIQVNIDSRDGYKAAAEAVDKPELSAIFSKVAVRRDANVTRLQSIVTCNGKESNEDASLFGKTHKTWLTFRAALSGGKPEVVATEAERGENHLREMYKEALVECMGTPVEEMLREQFASVKEDHSLTETMKKFYN